MSRIVIVNNKKGNSTVLNAFAKNVVEYFDELIVVTPKLTDSNELKKIEDITIRQMKLTSIISAVFKAAWSFLKDKDVRKDLYNATCEKKLTVRFLKTYARSLVKAFALYNETIRVVNNTRDNVVFSTWFAENAFAAAKVKEKFASVVSMSYAHSYEIDWRKNPFVGLILESKKAKYLDEVFFISENVMKEYLNRERTKERFSKKCFGLHFGSEKFFDTVCSPSPDGVFRILTCSGMSSVKRLDLLVEALELYEGPKLHWTHIGDGEMYERLVEKAQRIGRDNVSFDFVGRLTNRQVHKYYTENSVDLFLNISSSEGLPVSIMEAMSYGVPVLATDVGGNSEIVNMENGWLVSSEVDASELSRLLQEIATCPMAITKRHAAYSTWDEEYQIKKNVSRLVARMKARSESLE